MSKIFYQTHDRLPTGCPVSILAVEENPGGFFEAESRAEVEAMFDERKSILGDNNEAI
jgi:hypothetical protein